MRGRPSALILVLLLAGFFPLCLAAEVPALNQRIVEFCQQNLGKKVGDGDCFDLAKHAFKHVGASRKFKEDPNKGDFVWGTLVCRLEAGGQYLKSLGKMEQVVARDVIQFRNTAFKGKKHRQYYGHHTAVVGHISGTEIKLLQQNFGGKKFVTEQTLHWSDLNQGWIRVYRPVPKKNNNTEKDDEK